MPVMLSNVDSAIKPAVFWTRRPPLRQGWMCGLDPSSPCNREFKDHEHLKPNNSAKMLPSTVSPFSANRWSPLGPKQDNAKVLTRINEKLEKQLLSSKFTGRVGRMQWSLLSVCRCHQVIFGSHIQNGSGRCCHWKCLRCPLTISPHFGSPAIFYGIFCDNSTKIYRLG